MLRIVLTVVALILGHQPLLAEDDGFDVVRQLNVMVPARDGVGMSTNIYRPDAPGQFPVILNRTPYDNESHTVRALEYAKKGYVYISQDTRGRHDSEGTWAPAIYDAKDGYDTQEWIGQQPWSNGKICTVGGSYEAWTQWYPATLANKNLTCMVPTVAPAQPFRNFPYENGILYGWAPRWMLWMDGRTMHLGRQPLTDVFGDAFYEKIYDWDKVIWTLPLSELDNAAGREVAWWNDWMAHDSQDEYWEAVNYEKDLDRINVPVFHLSGWYDLTFPGTVRNYPRVVAGGASEHARSNQKLLIWPTGHWGSRTTDGKFGSMDFGQNAATSGDDAGLDVQKQIDRWLDYWLKGEDNGIMDEPRVTFFVLGANEWRHADAWPLSDAQNIDYYLHSGGHANTFHGDGLLTTTAPSGNESADRYTYDPADPTPSAKRPDPAVNNIGAEDLRPIHHRQDVLVYQTPPLEEAVEVIGPITLTLYAASSARDTDWIVRLSDVHPDGYAMRLGHGALRARFRESLTEPRLLEPGKVYEYTIELWPTANRFRAGHRIRLDIASAAFPIFLRNLNTGGNNQTTSAIIVAEQTVYHDEVRPSRLRLPVVPID